MFRRSIVCLLLACVAAPVYAEEGPRALTSEALQLRLMGAAADAEMALRQLDAEEMREIEREIERNQLELIELEERVGPQVGRMIRRALVFGDRPMLGISIGPLDSPAADGDAATRGVGVLGVTPGGPADEAGIETGDLLLEFNGESLAANSSEEAQMRLLEQLTESEVSEAVSLKLERDGKTHTLSVTPTAAHVGRFEFPYPPRAPRAPGAPRHPGGIDHLAEIEFMLSDAQRQWEGVELVELTPGLGRYFGTDEGLLVIRKPAGGALPLEEGDVIRRIGDRQPKSVSQAVRILHSYDAGEELEIEVMRDKKRRELTVTVPAKNQD